MNSPATIMHGTDELRPVNIHSAFVFFRLIGRWDSTLALDQSPGTKIHLPKKIWHRDENRVVQRFPIYRNGHLRLEFTARVENLVDPGQHPLLVRPIPLNRQQLVSVTQMK